MNWYQTERTKDNHKVTHCLRCCASIVKDALKSPRCPRCRYAGGEFLSPDNKPTLVQGLVEVMLEDGSKVGVTTNNLPSTLRAGARLVV